MWKTNVQTTCVFLAYTLHPTSRQFSVEKHAPPPCLQNGPNPK